MLDIQNIGLVELNAQEVQEVAGGGGGGVLGFIWNNILVSGFNDIFHATSNTVNNFVNFLGGNTTGMVNPNQFML